MRHVCSLILLLIVAVPGFAQQIRFHAETPAAAPEYGESRTGKFPQVATNGDGYLAVWQEQGGSIFSARLAADGTLLDPINRFLATGFGPAVLWTGSEYAMFFNRAEGVLGITVSPDGMVSEPKLVHALAAGTLEVATNGNTIAILSSQSMLIIVDGELNLLAQRVLRTTLGDFHSSDIVAVGSTYVMAAGSYRDSSVRTVVVGEEGNFPIANAVRVIPESTTVREVALATDGTNVLVVWSRVGESLLTQRITPDNRLLGGTQTLVNDDGAANATRIDRLRADWRGGEYLVTYTTNQFLETAWAAIRVNREGGAIGTPAPAFGGGHAGDVAVKPNGSGAVIWAQHDGREVRLGLFSTAAPVLDKTVAVAIAAKAQLHVAAERVGDAMVLGWVEQSAAGFEIRIARAGGAPISVRQAYADWLDVLYDGERVWVVWFDGLQQQLWVRRYTPDLQAIDAIPQPFGAPRAINGGPRAAAAGDRSIVVVWTTADEERELVATVFRSDEQLVTMTPEAVLASEHFADGEPVAGWDGASYLIAWRHQKEEPPWQFPMPVDEAIHARRVTREGTRLEAEPIVVYDKPGEWSASLRMSVAGANVVLAWQETAGTMVLRWNGTPGGERLIDSRNRNFWSLAGIGALPNGDVDLYWSTVPVDPQRFLSVVHRRFRADDSSLSAETLVTQLLRPGFELDFDAAVTSGGLPFLAYVRLATEPQYGGVERVFFVEGYAHAGRRRAVRS